MTKKGNLVKTGLILGTLAVANVSNANAQSRPTTSTRTDSSKTQSTFLAPRGNPLDSVIPGLFTMPWSEYCTTDAARRRVCPPALSELTQTGQHPSRNYMRNLNGLTMAGNGMLLSNYIHSLVLPATISSDSEMHFSVQAPREFLRRIARNQDNSPRGRAFRRYLENLAQNIPAGDAASRARINQALQNDGTITLEEARGIREGPVAIIARKGRESAGGVFNISYGGSSANTQRYQHTLDSLTEDYNERIRGLNDTLESTRAVLRTANARLAQNARDSIARANIQREALERQARQRAAQTRQPEFVPPTEHKIRNTLEFGVETEYGTNNELTAGVFANVRLFSGLRLEAYGNLSAVREKLYSTGVTQDTALRAAELIDGGTEKYRIDETTTSTRERGVYEFGGRIVIQPSKGLDLFLGAGQRGLTGIVDIDGKSTIYFTRNGAQLGPDNVITNSQTNNVHSSELALSAGARINLGRFGIQGSYNKEGKRDIWKVGGRVNFF